MQLNEMMTISNFLGGYFWVFIVIAVVVSFFWRKEVFPFLERGCQGKDWRRTFPKSSKEEIREFLSVFIGAFGFSEKNRLKLNPQDKVLDIYRAIYPHKGMPDGLELETLERDVLKKYGLKLRDIWTEQMTLGNLFLECEEAKTRS